MVKQVTAFQAEDGKVFPTADEAARHDARMMLVGLNMFTEGTVAALLREPHKMAKIMTDLAAMIPETEAPARD